jgi:MtfA peptidase
VKVLKSWRRKKLLDEPVSSEWEIWIDQYFYFYEHLERELRQRFFNRVRVFIDEKKITGVQGLKVTDEMKVLIAGEASRLTFFLGPDCYKRLSEVLIYPFDFRHPDERQAILGEVHEWGVVLLSWPALLEARLYPEDGPSNPALHEFAHVLDRATGEFDGTPLMDRKRRQRWAQVMSEHFLRLREAQSDELAALGDYAATNEAEFYAVSTEVYFEAPWLLRDLLPDLFLVLKEFYGFDSLEDPRFEKKNEIKTVMRKDARGDKRWGNL